MSIFFLPGGQAAFPVTQSEVLDHLRHLEQIARADVQHIFAVALVPVLAFAAVQAAQTAEESFRCRARADRPDAELFAGVDGDEQLRIPKHGLHRVVLRGRPVDRALHDRLDHPGAVQGMNNFVADLKHGASVPASQ